MKKILLGAAMALSMFALSAQVMPNSGVKNTLWAGFGSPDTENKNFTFYGFTDTLQARVDIAQFTMEGMINWGLFTDFDANGSRLFEFTQKTAFYVVNRCSDFVSTSETDSLTDRYYVNFLWHPFQGFDVGAGSSLNWKVGPAPVCGDYYWGKDAHIKQGGLKDNVPGLTDVAGFVYYPNVYAKEAIGLRYNYEDIFEAGFAIPSGASANAFNFNVGLKVQPIDLFAVSFAYEGVCLNEGNLYAGVHFNLSKGSELNVYLGMDRLGGNDNDGVNGLGVSGAFTVKSIGLRLTPEVGVTFYEDDDYTNAIYLGSGFAFDITNQFTFGAWLSFAWGAENKLWDDLAATRDWNGGSVFNVRPMVEFNVNKNNSISLYADYQQRTTFDHYEYSSWAAGMYWTYTN